MHAIPWLDAAEALQLLNDQGISAEIRHVHTQPSEHIANRLLFEADAIAADRGI